MIIEIGVNEKITDLIEGKTIDKEIHDNFVFQDFETDNELLWTLLTDNGYLTQLEKSDLLTDTSRNLISNNINEFEKGFRQIIGDTLSYFDIAEKTDKQNNEKTVTHEQIYHVYTLGLLTVLADDFIIKSNRESGQGRYDIMLIPYDKNRNGVVIEIKSTYKKKDNEGRAEFTKRINYDLKTALTQIDKNKYYSELIVNKIKPENIIKLAIIFAGKEPYINELN